MRLGVCKSTPRIAEWYHKYYTGLYLGNADDYDICWIRCASREETASLIEQYVSLI